MLPVIGMIFATYQVKNMGYDSVHSKTCLPTLGRN